MNPIKKIVFATVDESESGDVLYLSYRSSGANINTGSLCITEGISSPFYILSSTYPVVTAGDMTYNTNNLSSPFNGAAKYYNVAYAGAPEGNSYIVRIGITGQIVEVLETCSV